MNRKIRGLESSQEQRARDLVRDTRTLTQKIRDFLADANKAAISIMVLTTAGFFIPGITDLMFLLSAVMAFLCINHKYTLPFRLPKASHLPDYNDLIPGTNTPKPADGICYFGNERGSGKELWFNNNDMRTHVLIFGSTGSGKNRNPSITSL